MHHHSEAATLEGYSDSRLSDKLDSWLADNVLCRYPVHEGWLCNPRVRNHGKYAGLLLCNADGDFLFVPQDGVIS